MAMWLPIAAKVFTVSNMSYCRFENTSRDLQDCINTMSEAEDIPSMELSEYERDAMHGMYLNSVRFIDEYRRLMAASGNRIPE